MKNFVISLENADKRRLHIQQEFSKQGIDFNFFDAVTPATNEQIAKTLQIDILHTALKSKEISCALSHISLWQKMLDDNIDYMAIFEDDILLGKEANLYLNHDDWLIGGFDIIKIETYYRKCHLKTLTYQPIIASAITPRLLKQLKTKHVGGAGYILSQSGAKKLLDLVKPPKSLVPIDHLLFDIALKNSTIYQVVPAFCIQLERIEGAACQLPSYLDADRALSRQHKVRKQRTLTDNIQRFLYRMKDSIGKRTFYQVVDFE